MATDGDIDRATDTPDGVDEIVTFVVTKQVRQFKDSGVGLADAYRALTSRFPDKRITWNDVERLLEDKYREMNHLKARRES